MTLSFYRLYDFPVFCTFWPQKATFSGQIVHIRIQHVELHLPMQKNRKNSRCWNFEFPEPYCISASLTPPICSISSFKFRKHFVKFEFAAKSNSPWTPYIDTKGTMVGVNNPIKRHFLALACSSTYFLHWLLLEVGFMRDRYLLYWRIRYHLPILDILRTFQKCPL